MPGADEVGNRRERDKLTIAEVCADLDISRRTFYEWRMKGRAPKCITLPKRQPAYPPVRIPAVAGIAGGRLMEDGTTYDVRVYRTEVYKGAQITTYWVRWKAGDKVRKKSFRNAAQADSFRSSLLAAARSGEAFSLATGRPVAWKRHVSPMSWYALTLAYTSAKWNYVSPNHRRGIAEALTDATEAMLTVDEGPHPRDEIRRALRSWAFSARLQGEREPPADLADVVRWLEGATILLEELVRPGSGTLRTRLLLDRISRKKDGTTAAANTANRKRMVLGSVLDYACETGVLTINPVKRVKWAKPRSQDGGPAHRHQRRSGAAPARRNPCSGTPGRAARDVLRLHVLRRPAP
jgi:hypothetical protein